MAMDRATLLRRLKAQTPPDYLGIAMDYCELKDDEEQNPSIRGHLALLEESYRALAKSRGLLSVATAKPQSAVHSKPSA